MSRIKRLQEWMAQENLDGFLSCDHVTRRYLTGFGSSAGWVAVTADGLTLYCDSRYITAASQKADGWHAALAENGFYESLSAWAEENGLSRIGVESPRMTLAVFRKLQAVIGEERLVPAEDPVAQLRIVKDAKELAAMERAAAIADRAWTYLLGEIRPGRSERELARLLENRMLDLGGEEPAFSTIMASGENGACPHAETSARLLQTGDLVTVDFGCRADGYCSDMTRTVAIGRPDAEKTFWYESVLAAQLQAVEAVRPGASTREIDALARRVLEERGLAEYFGHALGHGVGLEVHELPTLSRSTDTVLQPGMVVTVEPGVYLPGRGGVRIEDTVVVTGDGCRRLTGSSKVLTIL